MGSYGIGVERAMAAIVECHHDDARHRLAGLGGAVQVVVTVAQAEDTEVAKAGERSTSSSPRPASR